MNSSNILKLFEYSILPKLKRHLKINKRQFGYRSFTGCPFAVAIVKETILNYTHSNSNVYSAVLDMSKAFDCLNFNVLFVKLVKSSLPVQLIRILMTMCRNSRVHVKFNGVTGEDWEVGNGTRQGGCLSGLIFNFYIDDIISAISECGVGCKLDYSFVNIVPYAEAFILLSPSANRLATVFI